MDWASEITLIEDALFPKLGLNVWERALYYHLLRHTRMADREEGVFGLLALANSLGISESTVRDSVRSLHDKGAIQIEERTRKGHSLRVVLPSEIDGLIEHTTDQGAVDIEALDFFSGRLYLEPLLKRESGRCFYCLRDVRPDSCVLDHVMPQVEGVNNSYRNVVVSCHECNALKQGDSAENFLRTLYRRNVLAVEELEQRISAIANLQSGKLVPQLSLGTYNNKTEPTLTRGSF